MIDILCFLVPDPVRNVTAKRINATAVMVSWIPLTLVEAQGFFGT